MIRCRVTPRVRSTTLPDKHIFFLGMNHLFPNEMKKNRFPDDHFYFFGVFADDAK